MQVLTVPLTPQHQTKCQALEKPERELLTPGSLWPREIRKYCFTIGRGRESLNQEGRVCGERQGGRTEARGLMVTTPDCRFAMDVLKPTQSFARDNLATALGGEKLSVLCLFTDGDNDQEYYLQMGKNQQLKIFYLFHHGICCFWSFLYHFGCYLNLCNLK